MLLSPQLRLDHFKIPLPDPGPGMASLSRRSEGSCVATRSRHASRRKLFTESLSWSRRVRFVGPSTPPLLPPFPRHFPLFASPLFSLHFSTSHRPLASPLYLPSDLFILAMFGGYSCKGPFTNDVSREGEGGGYPKSDAVMENGGCMILAL